MITVNDGFSKHIYLNCDISRNKKKSESRLTVKVKTINFYYFVKKESSLYILK